MTRIGRAVKEHIHELCKAITGADNGEEWVSVAQAGMQSGLTPDEARRALELGARIHHASAHQPISVQRKFHDMYITQHAKLFPMTEIGDNADITLKLTIEE